MLVVNDYMHNIYLVGFEMLNERKKVLIQKNLHSFLDISLLFSLFVKKVILYGTKLLLKLAKRYFKKIRFSLI